MSFDFSASEDAEISVSSESDEESEYNKRLCDSFYYVTTDVPC